MAKKISELNAISELSNEDVMPIVDVSLGTTNKVAFSEFVNAIEEMTERNILTATLNSDVTLTSSNDTPVTLVLANSVGSKLSVSNGGIVIGSGVSKVLVSGKANFNSLTSSNNQRYFKVKKNGTEILVSRNASPSNTNGLALPITPNLIDVSEGDVFTISTQGVNGDVLRATSTWTYITIEVVE